MAEDFFELLGHDNPLGYPAPVVPIGRRNGQLVAFYASDRVTELVIENQGAEFIEYSGALKTALRDFDYYNERLFGFNDDWVVPYKIDEQSAYFQGLLGDIHFSLGNPFLRLSLAKATGESHLTIREVFLCSLHLVQKSANFTEAWYNTQRNLLELGGDCLEALYLPGDWRELRYYITPEQVRLVESSVKADDDRRETPAPYRRSDFYHRPGRSELSKLSDAEIVKHFNSLDPKSTEGTKAFEEVISRYMPLIRKVVRRHEKALPPWESAEDVASRVVLSVYKNMHVLEKAENIKGYIAAVAKNTAIDAAIRGRREEKYLSREGGFEESDASIPIIGPNVFPQVEGHSKSTEQSILLDQLLAEICQDYVDELLVKDYFMSGMRVKDIAPKTRLTHSTIYRRIKKLRERMLGWFKSHGISSLSELL